MQRPSKRYNARHALVNTSRVSPQRKAKTSLLRPSKKTLFLKPLRRLDIPTPWTITAKKDEAPEGSC